MTAVLSILGLVVLYCFFGFIYAAEARSALLQSLMGKGWIKQNGLVTKLLCKISLHTWGEVRVDPPNFDVRNGIRYGDRTCVSCGHTQAVSGITDSDEELPEFWFKLQQKHAHFREEK